MTKVPGIGKQVNYVPTAKQKEKWRVEFVPAIIVKVWATDMVNLRIFPDAPPSPEDYVNSIEYSGLHKDCSWHWPNEEND